MVYTNDLCDVDILMSALVDGCMMPDAMYIMKISTKSIEDGNVYRILHLQWVKQLHNLKADLMRIFDNIIIWAKGRCLGLSLLSKHNMGIITCQKHLSIILE